MTVIFSCILPLLLLLLLSNCGGEWRTARFAPNAGGQPQAAKPRSRTPSHHLCQLHLLHLSSSPSPSPAIHFYFHSTLSLFQLLYSITLSSFESTYSRFSVFSWVPCVAKEKQNPPSQFSAPPHHRPTPPKVSVISSFSFYPPTRLSRFFSSLNCTHLNG